MKGLLKKDLRRMFRSWYFWLSQVVIGVQFLAYTRIEDFPPAPAFLDVGCMIALFAPTIILSEDERDRWQSYCLTLPCTRKDYVSGKYLLHLLLLGIILVEVIVFWLFWGAWVGIALAPMLCHATVIVLFSTAIRLPLTFRFGEYGSFALLMVFLLPVWLVKSDLMGQMVLTLAALGIFGLSWPASIHWYSLRWKKGKIG